MSEIAKWNNVSVDDLSGINSLGISGSVVYDRGIGNLASSFSASASNSIEYISFSTTGNSTYFGDLLTALSDAAAYSNGINERGIFHNGSDGTNYLSTIQYVAISVLSNSIYFGAATYAQRDARGASNKTNDRGVRPGGYNGTTFGLIEYITISTLGGSSYFGDMAQTTRATGCTSNGTNERALYFGGVNGSNAYQNVIGYFTINTIGNAADFGDLLTVLVCPSATSNWTNERALVNGGSTSWSSGFLNTMQYSTINSLGNSTYFGAKTIGVASASSSSNGVFAVTSGGRYASSSDTNIIDYTTINSLGNAIAFGTLSSNRFSLSATENI